MLKLATDLSHLLSRIAGGDKTALAELFALESGRMLSIARRILRRTDLAEEIVQESFVAIWQRAGQFDPARGSAQGWLGTIVRNRAINLIRDGSRLQYHDGETLTALGDQMGDARDAFETLAERDALRLCLDQLDQSKRDAILLCYVTGLNHGEVAAKLSAPLGTVKAWIRRGTIALQECLS